jgi:hypothetical protein
MLPEEETCAYSANGRTQVASFKGCVLPRNPLRTRKRGGSNGQYRGAVDLQLTLVGACITQCARGPGRDQAPAAAGSGRAGVTNPNARASNS